jgi:fructose-1,6-bisphosphatase/inositol monophosphatase family enzyme
MAEQQLNRPQVLGSAIDQRCLRTSHCVSAILSKTPRIPDRIDELVEHWGREQAKNQEGRSTQMNDVNLPQLLIPVIDVVESAGRLIEAEWTRAGGPRGHGDKAEVDVEIELILRQRLLALLACDFWGEETGHELTGNPFCWVVDPNDGTSDFLKGLKGSAVSVGLLHNNIPVLGVVYAPVIEDRGADCIAWAEGVPELLRNGQPVRVDLTYRQLTDAEHVMVSAAAVSKPQLNAELCAPGRFVAMPSIAYRLARVAAGDGLCAVSLYPVSAHDVVAGHALLRASGGTLVNQDGVEITYRTVAAMSAVSERCFGGAPQACETLLARDWQRLLSNDAS